jgi:hypothetical protein
MNLPFVDPSSHSWYWKAMVIAYMCRLNGRTESAITEIMKTAGLPFNALQQAHFDVSVHVRKGDKIIREMGAISDEHFIRTCLLIRKLLGRNITVFLCTDDNNALEAMKTVPGIRLFWLNYEFRKDNSFRKLAKHGDRATVQALADFALAARSTYFVGLWNSNVERLIMELRGTVYNMASNWYLEMGKMKCVSWAHCRIVHSDFNYAYKGEWL